MHISRHDIKSGHLSGVLHRLSELGVTDVLEETAALLSKADALRRVDSADARERYDDLPRQVASGVLSLPEAVERATELAPWVSKTDAYSTARRIAELAAEQVERDALEAAKREASEALSALVPLAAAAVDEAVQAGNEILAGMSADTLLQDYKRQYLGGGTLPRIFTTDVTTLDRGKLTAWGRADEATRRFRQIREAAAELQQLDMPALRGVAVPTHAVALPPSERGMIERLPEPLQLAAMANSGMKPGLVLTGTAAAPYEPAQSEKSQPLRRFFDAVTGGGR